MIILNFESGIRFQDFRKNNHHFGLFSTPFSLDINFLPANFLIECIEIQLDTDRKKNLISLYYNFII